MTSSAFPSTPTVALDILLNITLLRKSHWLRQCEGDTESLLVGYGISTQLIPLGKRKATLMFAMRLKVLQIPTDRIKKTKEFETNFQCQIMDNKKNALRSESLLNQNTVRVFTLMAQN